MDVYDKKRAWKTESYRERVLSALSLVPFAEERLVSIGTDALVAYREQRLKASAPSTVRQDLAAIQDCFKWARRLGYVRRNPAEGVDRPSLPTKQDDPAAYLTPEQFSDLCGKAGRDLSLYEFDVWTGLRITELITLEWPDVHEDYVVVRRGKGRKQRIVPLIKEAKAALAKAPRHLTSQRIFWWSSDRHSTLRRFQRRLKWAGISRRYRFHDLRHTFGAYAAQSGVDLEVIAACMGHTSTTVTKLYAHLHPSYKRKELVRMQGFGRKTVEASRKQPKRKAEHQH